MRKIEFLDLGVKPYRESWEMQQQLLERVKTAKIEKTPGNSYLLFVEHPAVYTLGKSGDEANMLINSIQLRAKHAEFIKVDRGGDITFHGPGQLVVYPVIDLEAFGLGVKEYVYKLEEVVIRTLAGYNVIGDRMEGATGVWLDTGTPQARKICAIGVKCSRYVSMHGFALNINTDLTYFDCINPCGFKDKGVTSLMQELGKEQDMEKLKQAVLKEFQSVFDTLIF